MEGGRKGGKYPRYINSDCLGLHWILAGEVLAGLVIHFAEFVSLCDILSFVEYIYGD